MVKTHIEKKKNKTNEEIKNIKKWDKFRQTLIQGYTYIYIYILNGNLIFNIKNINIKIKKELPSGVSYVSIEFLRIFQKTNNIEIQTGENNNEFGLRKKNGYIWPVDGYHNCSKHKCIGNGRDPCFWDRFVFEFQGTYWHRDKKKKDLEKKQFYIKNGYKWFEISEKFWTNKKKLLKSIKNLSK